MTFNEANTVEQMVIDACVELGWHFVPPPTLPQLPPDVFVESQLRKALTLFNQENATQPDRGR